VVPKRRTTELVLSLFALAIAMFAFADVGLTADGKLPDDLWGYAGGMAAVVLMAHLAVRRFAPYADPLLLPLVTFVNGLGLVLIHRLDIYDATVAAANHRAARTGDAVHQLIWTGVSVIAFVAILMFLKDHRILQRYAYLSMVVGMVLLALPAVLPASMSEVNGARSWIILSGFLEIQPSEFAKLLLAVFFAAFLVQRRDSLALASRRVLGIYLPRGRDLGPIVVVWLLSLVIMLRETELGVSLLFFGLFVVMLYIATERTSWLIFGLVMFSVGATLVAQLEPHVMHRVTAWLHPFSDVQNTTFQIAQSLFGFSAGGIFGTGLDQGHSYLVAFAYKTDFILVTVGEELGLAGLMALFTVYALIVVRGFKASLMVRDPFGKLFAGGLAVVFALEVFITAGGVMDLIPLTGLPMPFLAQGGSALLANWMLLALLIRISDAGRRPVPPARPLAPDYERTQVVRP
jgi:cell division protein FtsW (lipid II flippase)